MKVLITGGLGYVGGRVARHLQESSDIDVWISTRRPNDRLPLWFQADRVLPHAELMRPDHPQWGSFDAVIHLGTANETLCNKDPFAAINDNVIGTMRLLDCCSRNLPRFIYFSSIHVYGTPLSGVLDEGRCPVPFQPYAIAHRTVEDFVLADTRQGLIDGVIIRLGNAFGAPCVPGFSRWSLVCNDLCRQAVTQGELRLQSSGLQIRNFVTLTDVSRAVEHVLRLSVTAVGGRVFNLGAPRSMPVLELARTIVRRCHVLFGYEPALIAPPPKPGERIDDFDLRVDRLLQTGFSFTSSLEPEIDATLNYCRESQIP